MYDIHFPQKVRVSSGSASILGLTSGLLNAKPTTAYILTHHLGKCYANCGFCPQARTSKSKVNMLSRVPWPTFPTRTMLSKLKEAFTDGIIQRVCIQALNYPSVFKDVLNLVKGVQSMINMPISVCCQPLNIKQMRMLMETGVDRLSIPLDASNEEIFNKIKGFLVGGPYIWKKQIRAIKQAVKVFGAGHVTTHLIVGLGENDKELLKTVQWSMDSGVFPSLFSFTPIPGTALEYRSQTSLHRYRMIQIAHYLILKKKTRFEKISFDTEGNILALGVSQKQLKQAISIGQPFITSGCPGCNRPYYNEKPTGPIYNYPSKPLPEEIAEIATSIFSVYPIIP